MYTYEEACEYILNIPKFNKTDKKSLNKSGNDNLRILLGLLGDPHKKIKCIHVAGTNGKGSVCKFIECLLIERNYSVGVFTSPHLVDITERIRAFEKDISKEDFAECFNIVKEAETRHIENGYKHLSFFEYLFAMAAVYFEKVKPDFVVYETGLGGRLDATNLVSPEISIITSIGLDHTKYLGDNVMSIAKEKAGIIKPGVPVVYNTGDKVADTQIEKFAKFCGSAAINAAKAKYSLLEYDDRLIAFSYDNGYYKYGCVTVFNTGTYQMENAVTAITAVNRLFADDGYYSEEEVNHAFFKFRWSGRMERVASNIIIDGAHNLDAIKQLTDSINKVYAGREIHLFFAVSEDKDYESMIKHLCDNLNICGITVTSVDSNRAASAYEVMQVFRKHIQGIVLCSNPNLEQAFRVDCMTAEDQPSMLLLCVGSLYLVGAIKKLL